MALRGQRPGVERGGAASGRARWGRRGRARSRPRRRAPGGCAAAGGRARRAGSRRRGPGARRRRGPGWPGPTPTRWPAARSASPRTCARPGQVAACASNSASCACGPRAGRARSRRPRASGTGRGPRAVQDVDDGAARSSGRVRPRSAVPRAELGQRPGGRPGAGGRVVRRRTPADARRGRRATACAPSPVRPGLAGSTPTDEGRAAQSRWPTRRRDGAARGRRGDAGARAGEALVRLAPRTASPRSTGTGRARTSSSAQHRPGRARGARVRRLDRRGARAARCVDADAAPLAPHPPAGLVVRARARAPRSRCTSRTAGRRACACCSRTAAARDLRRSTGRCRARGGRRRRLGEADVRAPRPTCRSAGTSYLSRTDPDGGEPPRAAGVLVVTPRRLRAARGPGRAPAWGFMTQLYSVRSRGLVGRRRPGRPRRAAPLARARARRRLRAGQPAARGRAGRRRWSRRRTCRRPAGSSTRCTSASRTSARPPTCPAADRALVEWQAEELRELDTATTASSTATRSGPPSAPRSSAVFAAPRSPARQAAFEAFCEREGEGLATSRPGARCAEHYGLPAAQWPARAARPGAEAVARLRAELADRVEFHMWLQWVADEQLGGRPARPRVEAGMAIGIMHDLAVGVHPDGADTWALRDVLARGVSVGAPPDTFNQQGQDWSPAAVAPGRARARRVRAVPRHAAHRAAARAAASGSTTSSGCSGCGGSRTAPARPTGTYVRYDHEALIGILVPRGAPGRRVRRRRGPRHRRAVGARLPARARRARHVDAVVREGRGRRAAGARAVARAVPGDRDHPRPAADRRATSPASTSTSASGSGLLTRAGRGGARGRRRRARAGA